MKRTSSPKPGEPSQRQLRVGEELRHILSGVLERENHHSAFLLNGYVTVTEVRVSIDLRHAKVYVMTMGGKNLADTVNALNDIAPILQAKMGKQLTLKFTPKLWFQPDQSYDEADKIQRLLDAEKKRFPNP